MLDRPELSAQRFLAAPFVRAAGGAEARMYKTGDLERLLPDGEAGAIGVRQYAPPEGLIESSLAQIWAELLHLERVGRDDDFFALGGHSLLAVELVAACKRAGLNIPVTAVFTQPTLRALASYLHAGLADAEGPIRLRAGAGPSLFLLPEAKGEMMYGPPLTAHIDPAIAVAGLTAPAKSEPALRTLQGMAARFVRIIRAAQPNGPYRLAGWSMGGMLAYEVASQLIGMDERIEFLGLIDTLVPRKRRPPRAEGVGFTDEELVGLLVDSRPHAQARALALVNEVAGQGAAGDALGAKVHVLQTNGLLPRQLSADDVRRWLSHMTAALDAFADYRPQPIPVKTHVFVAADTRLPDGSAPPPDLGWHQVLPASLLEFVSVPGQHGQLMYPPNVRPLGAALSAAVASAAGSSWCEAVHEPLVTLQTGGAMGPVLCCVPGAGASVTAFNELARAIGSEWWVHGFQTRGLADGRVPYASVEAAAAAYVRAIEARLPGSPVHLLGHSFGGWIVFEMAAQLRSAGRAPASLTIVDSEPPASSPAREHSRSDVLMSLIRLFEQSAQRSLQIETRDIEELEDDEQLRLLHARLVAVGLMPPRSAPGHLAGVVNTYSINRRTRYEPAAVYPEPVHLGLAAATAQGQALGAIGRWQRWAPNIRAWQTSGNHMTMLEAPHALALAQRLRAGPLLAACAKAPRDELPLPPRSPGMTRC